MTDGKTLADELRHGKDGGIPWSVILDGDGKAQITSDAAEGNIGCPAKPEEIEHFLKMLDATRQHMTADDRAIIERELRAYGAELTRPRQKAPGRAAYAEAVSAVKFGRFAAAVESLGEACADGFAAEAILVDPALRPLREDPDRRLELAALVKQRVQANAITLVDPDEPGERIRLLGHVVDQASGEPLAGALVQLFHTDASGEYRPGMDAGGGAGNPRLFGFVRADAEGRFTVDTIMPERYPNSTVPRHVHYKVEVEGRPLFASECFFDADPNLSPSARRTAPERNFPIVELRVDAEHRQVGTLTVRVPK